MATTDASDLLPSAFKSFSVRLTLPPTSYLKLPPAPLPITLPPPTDHPTLAHPFTIPADWYNSLLSPSVPITIAIVYASCVSLLNSVNTRRKFKPWAFSQTGLFKVLVISHNIFLALYSLWTFIGMYNAARLSIEPPQNEYRWAGFVDSLCKIHGPRGLGSAATYNASTTAWTITNRAFHLGADGLTPDATDVGRLWNEGLAFYGWLFYISKFYEVIDTLIILAKGKKSSLLQTYHHAGAMMGMWAGIRYMSPPIWMFVFINSFIHTVMYTFYLCSAINVKVPVWFKRTLTTMQITQFVFGASYAFAHLFIKYETPVTISYIHHLGKVASAVHSDASTAASIAMASMSADAAAWLKKAALRAAGREGLAENVLNKQGETFGFDAVHAIQDFAKREEIRYREELRWVHCLDTSGETFAILLNCIYLAPLTWLFAQFFIKSYLQRIERRRSSSSASQRAYSIGQSGKDAIKGVGRRLSQAFEDSQGGVMEVDEDDDDIVIVNGEKVREEMAAVFDRTAAEAKEVAEKSKEQADQVIGAGSSAREELRASIVNLTSQEKAPTGQDDDTSRTLAEATPTSLDDSSQQLRSESSAIEGETTATAGEVSRVDTANEDLSQIGDAQTEESRENNEEQGDADDDKSIQEQQKSDGSGDENANGKAGNAANNLGTDAAGQEDSPTYADIAKEPPDENDNEVVQDSVTEAEKHSQSDKGDETTEPENKPVQDVPEVVPPASDLELEHHDSQSALDSTPETEALTTSVNGQHPENVVAENEEGEQASDDVKAASENDDGRASEGNEAVSEAADIQDVAEAKPNQHAVDDEKVGGSEPSPAGAEEEGAGEPKLEDAKPEDTETPSQNGTSTKPEDGA